MTINPNERLSRFILHKNEFRRSNLTVKFKAFVPPTNKRLSVYRTSTLCEDDIWSIGSKFVAKPRGKTLYGRADLFARTVYALKQKVEPETSLHCLHADVRAWPDNKDDIQFLATQLALQSKFIPNPIL